MLQNTTEEHKKGDQTLSEVLVHSVNLWTCGDYFRFHFKYEDKEEGVAQTTGSFTPETGKVYHQKRIDTIFGIGFYGTLTPASDGYHSQGQNCGMYEEIRMRDHFEKMHPDEGDLQRPFKEARQKNQEYLEQVTELEYKCREKWEKLHKSREEKNSPVRAEVV